MKPKNLILIAVAVACGLVAAFLTARMSAGGSIRKPQLDMVEVPVAVRDIPIGTKLPASELETFFVKKNLPREAVPPSAILSLDEIGDMRTMRTVRVGETVSANDVNAKGFIDPPDGMVLMTAPISLEQSASGFALPGYKVMVIASKKSQRKNKEIVFPLFLDALILAVDTSPTAPQAGGSTTAGGPSGPGNGATAAGFQNVSMISFAVTPDQSMLLAMAADGGARLRIGLPNQAEDKKQVVIDGYKHLIPTREEALRIFADQWDDPGNSGSQPPVEVVRVKVPGEPLPAGTQITREVLDGKFKTADYPKELVHATAAADDKDLLDKFTQTELVPALLVPKAHLGSEPPKKAVPQVIREAGAGELAGVKAGHADDAASPKGATDTSPSEPPAKEYVYVAITTPQGKRYQKFEVTKDGNRPVGDVTEEEYQRQSGTGGRRTN
jgi:pilus assembly protein CpaB